MADHRAGGRGPVEEGGPIVGEERAPPQGKAGPYETQPWD